MSLTCPTTWEFTALGCPWTIETTQSLDTDLRAALLARAERFDRTWSRFREDSLVSEIARAPAGGRFAIDGDDVVLLDLYDELHSVTNGAVDPLVGRDLELLGYDAGYSLTPVAAAERIAHAAARPRWSADVVRDGRTIRTHGPVVIDIGAIGKGHLVDLLCGMLQKRGIASGLVDASGDLRRFGAGTDHVGLEDPDFPGHAIGIADIAEGALCASATNRRRWAPDLHHIVDGLTGTPTRGIAASWVTADTAAVADGLATALFFTDPAVLTASFAFEWAVMTDERTAAASPSFPGSLFWSERDATYPTTRSL